MWKGGGPFGAGVTVDYERALVLIAQKRQDRLGKPIEDLKRRLELALATSAKGTSDNGGTHK